MSHHVLFNFPFIFHYFIFYHKIVLWPISYTMEISENNKNACGKDLTVKVPRTDLNNTVNQQKIEYIEYFTQQEQNIHFLSTMEYLPSIQYLEHKKKP